MNKMTGGRWLAVTISMVMLVCLLFVAVNTSFDVYGLFRDARGRELIGVDDERTSKYLLSYSYIPENFDALLIGSSVTGNWDVSHIGAFRVYNASLSGGNVTEEQAIVDRILRKGRIKLAICVVHPYMTESHGFKAVTMNSKEFWSALGSMKLLKAYWARLRVATGRARMEFDKNGTAYWPVPKVMNPHLAAIMKPGTDFDVDDIALRQYISIIQDLREHGAQIVVVVPPLYQRILDSKQAALQRYYARMLPIFSKADLVIDFNAPEFVDFRRNRDNFGDGVHLTVSGAHAIVGMLNERIQEFEIRNATQRASAGR